MFAIGNGKVVLLNKLTHELPLETNSIVSRRPPVIMAEMAFYSRQYYRVLD